MQLLSAAASDKVAGGRPAGGGTPAGGMADGRGEAAGGGTMADCGREAGGGRTASGGKAGTCTAVGWPAAAAAAGTATDSSGRQVSWRHRGHA